MDGEFILRILQMYGFPALMCLWFMLRCEKRLDAIERQNYKLLTVMAVLVRSFDEKGAEIPEDLADDVAGLDSIPLPPGSSEEKKA